MPYQNASPKMQFFDANGNPLVGGKVYTYAAGTTTPLATYVDQLGTAQNTNPVILDSRGEADIWFSGTSMYALTLKTSADVLIYTVDNMGANFPASNIPFTPVGAIAATNVQAAIAEVVSDLAASSGASLVGTPNLPAPAYLKTVSDILSGDEVLIDRFLPTAQIAAIRARTSAYDCGPDLAAATLAFTRGGGIYAKQGKYVFNSGFILLNNTTLRGDGYSTEFSLPSDIELIKSDTTTASTVTTGVVIKDLFVRKEITGATANYDIHLSNPQSCVISRVRVQSGHIDSAYSSTNVGGIWLDKPAGSATNAFMNLVENCWIQNNSIYLNGVTDSAVRGGYVWGHVRQFAIRLSGGGANAIEKVEGIICSKYNGGIWIDGAGINQCRIIGNEFDGNPLLDTGTGIYAPNSSIAILVNANTFWGCDKHGIDTTDPVGWTVTGNAFWKNNAADNFYDDVRITGVGFGPNGNVVSGNTHVMDEARTNKGYAIREVNGGFNPTRNTYTGNGVLGSTGYVNPSILVLGDSTLSGNTGVGADSIAALTGVTLKLGKKAISSNAYGDIAASGVLDMPINTETFLGAPGGFAGVLSVSSTRTDFATQSRRQIYAVVCRGTTATFTQIGTTLDGSGGGKPFTLTMISDGVIRFTDTSTTVSSVCMAFNGTKSLA